MGKRGKVTLKVMNTAQKTLISGNAKMLSTLLLLRDNLGSVYRFHEVNDVNETSPKVACESYQRDIKSAIIMIEKTLGEVGYTITGTVLEKDNI